jgi:hypothetical protein
MQPNKTVTPQQLRRGGFVALSRNTYTKYEPMTGIRTTVTFDHKGKAMHVRHDQDVTAIIELNKIRQNEHRGSFKGELLSQVTSIPMLEHKKIMEKCGYVKGQGYDEKKFKQILNDPDYRYFKTVNARL